jgi:2,5-furandicarboxylate decarboxylase 1
MNVGLREHLDVLRAQDKLLVVDQEVDLRYASAIIAKAGEGGKAVAFRRPKGYEPQLLVGGLFGDKERTGLAYGCPYEDAWRKVGDARTAAQKAVLQPLVVEHSPAWEQVEEGDNVDLSALPLPVLAHKDGAPYISAAITGSADPDQGHNWGVYRYQVLNRNTLAIDLTTQNNMHNYLKRAYAEGRPFGVTVNIGNHPFEFLAAGMDVPAGVDEMAVAGGLRGEPVALVPGATVEAMAIANSEYILEGAFLPGGWSQDEGRFGEFHGLMGSMHKNPALRIHRVARRRDAHLYTLQMAYEVNYMYIPITTMAAHRALLAAGIEPVAINVTMGGCTAFHVIASIKKFPGGGKNAILALMNVGIVKHVVVTDADIDVFDPEQVEWAIATRVQVEKDVVIVPGMGRAKPLDPVLPPEMDPMLITRLGIDATMPEGIPAARYERIQYPHLEEVDIGDLLAGNVRGLAGVQEPEGAPAEELADQIADYLQVAQPIYYMEILDRFATYSHRNMVQAMGILHDQGRLRRDEEGRYLRAGMRPDD